MHHNLPANLITLPPRTRRLLMLSGWIVLAIALAGIGVRMQTLVTVRSDFTQDYLAAQALRQGVSIYERFTPADLAAHGLKAEVLDNYHPPSTIMLLAPLGFLPYPVAVGLWTALSLLLYVSIWWVILRELGLAPAPGWLPLLAGMALLWYPFQFHVILAQVSLPLVACLVGSWLALRRGRDGLAGVLIGLAILLKLFPALLLLYLLLRRRWRALGAALATGALGAVVTLAVVGLDDVLRYQREVAPQNLEIFRTALHNVSLSAVFSRLFIGDVWLSPLVEAPRLAAGLAFAANLALLALLALVVWRQPRTGAGDDMAFALVCAAMPLLTPTSWSHSFPLLILPFALLLRALLAQPSRRAAQILLLTFVLVSLPDIPIARIIAALYVPERVPWFATLPMLLPTAGLLMLNGLLWMDDRRWALDEA